MIVIHKFRIESLTGDEKALFFAAKGTRDDFRKYLISPEKSGEPGNGIALSTARCLQKRSYSWVLHFYCKLKISLLYISSRVDK